MKNTIWSKWWAAVGIFTFSFGVFFGTDILLFVLTSSKTHATVINVVQNGGNGTGQYIYTFATFDLNRDYQVYTMNMSVSNPIYGVGDVVYGRVSMLTGRILSKEILEMVFLRASLLTLIGAVLGRHVIFRFLSYAIGFCTGNCLKLRARIKG